MVVKPTDFEAFGPGGLLQPAVKCRGREYLRIIYGPDYDLPHHLRRFKKRGLGKKRSLALRRVHESVFGVLVLESEEVDGRL